MIDFYVEKDIDLIYEELIKSFDLITRDQIINEQKLTINRFGSVHLTINL